MLSAITKIPELKIDKDESEILGRGIANVARHYDIGGASEKTLDWFNLIQALAMVYGPRVFVVAGRRKQKRAEKPAAPKSEEGGNGFDGFPAVVQMQ